MKQKYVGYLITLSPVACILISLWLVNYSDWAWFLVIGSILFGIKVYQDSVHGNELRLREQLRREYPGIWRSDQPYEEIRRMVLMRDNYRCRQCGGTYRVEVHHITPKSKLGPNEPGNLITLCWHCHDSKHPGARKYYAEKYRQERRNRRQ